MKFAFLTAFLLCSVLCPVTAFSQTIVPQSQPLILKTAGQVYRLSSSLRFNGNGVYIAAPNVTLDLNGHTIYYGGNNAADAHGVILYIDGYHSELTIPGASAPTNAKIINGRILHEGAGATSHGIYSRRAHDALVENMRVEVNGTDSSSVSFTYYPFTVKGSVLISTANASFDRHAGPACVYGSDAVTASGNVIIGGNSGFNVGSGSKITGNVIAHNSHVTNGYGVFLYRNSNVLVSNNLILPSNGRGVILNAGTGHRILDNVILHLERPNTEFGDSLNPPAIRGRYDLIDIVYRGNTSLGIGGGGRTSASGIYLTEDGQGINTYESNSATTILVGAPDISHYAQPLTLEGQGYDQQSRSIVRNNTLRSNLYLIRTSGYDGSAEAMDPMVGNSLSYVDGNTARSDFKAAARSKLAQIGMNANPDALAVVSQAESLIDSLIADVPLQPGRATWFSMHYHGDVNVTVLNTQWGTGVARDSERNISLYTGVVHIRVGDTIRSRFVNAGDVPYANVAVTVTTDRGDVYPIKTDASGFADVPVIEFGLDKVEASGAPIVRNNRSSTTVTVTGVPPIRVNNTVLISAIQSGYTFRFGDSTAPDAPRSLRVIP